MVPTERLWQNTCSKEVLREEWRRYNEGQQRNERERKPPSEHTPAKPLVFLLCPLGAFVIWMTFL